MAKLRITYTKSAIGYARDQKDTIRSLGLRTLNSVVIRDDNPATRGMVFKVQHLVTVEEVADDAVAPARRSPSPRPMIRATAAPEQAPARPAAAPKSFAPAVAEEAPEDVAEEPAAPIEAKPAAPRKPAAKAEKGDDLAKIEGIGPKISGVLKAAGITTFAQLAEAEVERLQEILQDADLRLAKPESWPEQAALAAAGKWDELDRLQEELKGGRRES